MLRLLAGEVRRYRRPLRYVRNRGFTSVQERTGMLPASQHVAAGSIAETSTPTIINCTMWLDACYSTTTDIAPPRQIWSGAAERAVAVLSLAVRRASSDRATALAVWLFANIAAVLPQG